MGPWSVAAWLALGSAYVEPAGDPRAADRQQTRVIVFMLGEDQPQAHAVVSAVESQIADLEARVEVEALPASDQLGARLQAARGHAAAHDAIGVFWLDVDADGNLLLHLVDPDAERMLVRRVAPSPESDTAAVQTVAVIARGFTSALLEGRSIGLSKVETETEAASDDELAPLDTWQRTRTDDTSRGRVRLGAAYYGAHVAPQDDWIWQSGVSANLAWQWRVGVYAGLGYDVTQRFTTVTASALAMNTISSEVRRNPASAIVGYQHRWPRRRLAIDGELRFVADPHTVHNTFAVQGSVVSQDNVSLFLLASPRAALHFRPTPYFSAHLTLGAEVVLLGARFKAQFRDPNSTDLIEERQYLAPAVFRPLALAGITFYL